MATASQPRPGAADEAPAADGAPAAPEGPAPPTKLPPDDDREVDADASTWGPDLSFCASGSGCSSAARRHSSTSTSTSTTSESTACRQLGVADFKLGQTVGTGLTGSVRLATFRGNSDAAPLATKVMEKSELVRQKLARHVLSERQILSAVRHPFLVQLVASFQDETRLFMLMEFVNGGELKTRLEQAGKLPDASAKFYASELTLGLGYLHSSAIMHRDLKPANVLIDGCGHLKIADFGLAKVVHHLTWTLCGTPQYLAPECITGTGHGKAADWWSLGVLTYEMLAGTRPFVGSNVRRLYREVVEEDVFFPSDIVEDARGLIDGLLTKEQSCRLGGSAGDAEDVMGHRWFSSVDFGKVIQKQCEPPFVPRVRSPHDARLVARRRAPEACACRREGDRLVSEEQQALFHGFDAPADAARLAPRPRARRRSFWGRLCTSVTGRGA